MRLAARGARETDAGEVTIADAWLAGQLKRQAREVYVEAVLLAITLTGVVLVLPSPVG